MNPGLTASSRLSVATKKTLRKLDAGTKILLRKRKEEEEEEPKTKPSTDQRSPSPVKSSPRKQLCPDQDPRGPSQPLGLSSPAVFGSRNKFCYLLCVAGAGGTLQAACDLEHRNSQ